MLFTCALFKDKDTRKQLVDGGKVRTLIRNKDESWKEYTPIACAKKLCETGALEAIDT